MTGPRNAVTTNRGRTYQWKDDPPYVSVTTALSAMAKPALPNWAARSVAEFIVANRAQIIDLCDKGQEAAAIDLCKGSPWRQRDAAANIGTELHAAAEAHVLGQVIADQRPEVAPLLASFVGWLDAVRPVYEAAECTLYSRRWGYAGTADAIVTIDGVRWLIDYKTSEKGPWPEAGLQLAAYAGAEFIGGPDGSEQPVPAIDRCGVLKVNAGGCWLHPVESGPEMHRMFLYLLQVRRWTDEVAPSVVGAPLPCPQRATEVV